MRGSLEEALQSQRRALEEKELLEAELRNAQHAARVSSGTKPGDVLANSQGEFWH